MEYVEFISRNFVALSLTTTQLEDLLKTLTVHFCLFTSTGRRFFVCVNVKRQHNDHTRFENVNDADMGL